jgi:HJR/Mrr/RecB family endonuclease
VTAKKLSFKDAAIRILGVTGEPMSARDITDRAIADGLIETTGKTPAATMAAQLYVDINKGKSRFRKVGKGRFALKDQSGSASSADVIIQRQNELVRDSLKKRLWAMDAYQFEFLVADLLQKIGYDNVEVTKRSGDKGIDIVADLTLDGVTNVKTVVQVKRYAESNRVQGSTITQLRGSAEVDQRGLVITTSDFTKGAREEARAPNKMPVALVNGDKLVSLLIQHGVGVTTETVTLYSVDSEYFENVETPTSQRGGGGAKSRSLWPLPGGTRAYVETLYEFLIAVQRGVETKADAVRWFLATFDTVDSENTAGGYVNVPRSMGLISLEDGRITLTDAGAEFCRTRDADVVFDALVENVLGVEDILEFLSTAGEPQGEETILEFLRDNLDIEWTTFAQVNFRLQWLVNLGKVHKTPDGYSPST